MYIYIFLSKEQRVNYRIYMYCMYVNEIFILIK